MVYADGGWGAKKVGDLCLELRPRVHAQHFKRI